MSGSMAAEVKTVSVDTISFPLTVTSPRLNSGSVRPKVTRIVQSNTKIIIVLFMTIIFLFLLRILSLLLKI